MRRIGLSFSAQHMGESARKIIASIGERSRFRLQRTRSGSALTTEPEMLPAMTAMWRDRNLEDLPVCKDLARLARRVVVLDDADGVLWDSPSVLTDEDTSQKRTVWLAAELIMAVTDALEGRERMDQVKDKILEIAQSAVEGSDAEELVRQMITTLGTEQSSKTIRVLKTIHQDIVGHCTFQLKQHITSRFMTKDVRTPEGWRITIRVASDHVQVSHIRREQSVDQRGDMTNHWEFEWELRLLFDLEISEMRLAQLRVTDLFLSQNIDSTLEEQIKHDLLGGELS